VIRKLDLEGIPIRKIHGCKIGETKWPSYRRRSTNPPTWETRVEILMHFSKVMGVKKKGPHTLSFLKAQNTLTFGQSRKCSRETLGFSLPQIL
jgi:hypothetical protein